MSRQLGQIPASHARTTGVGLFVPKPTRDVIYHHSYLSDLPRTVRGRPQASAGVCGGCYSVSYSPTKGAVAGHRPISPATDRPEIPHVVRRLVERRGAQLVMAASAGDQEVTHATALLLAGPGG